MRSSALMSATDAASPAASVPTSTQRMAEGGCEGRPESADWDASDVGTASHRAASLRARATERREEEQVEFIGPV